jgi:murein DD-endopeptidase MepM/ murein hydrolase activator NlpD
MPASVDAMTDIDYLKYRHLVVPVAGADMSKVDDTFLDGRDNHRTHRAIDILAPRGTPILAADDGKILRMSTNSLGGISMYTVDPLNRIVYYYAHMDHYNDAMSPGRAIVRGDTLGFVGTTGNAPKDTPHLHFQIMRWPLDGKYWNGEPIDPFGLLGGVPRSERREHAGHPDDGQH